MQIHAITYAYRDSLTLPDPFLRLIIVVQWGLIPSDISKSDVLQHLAALFVRNKSTTYYQNAGSATLANFVRL